MVTPIKTVDTEVFTDPGFTTSKLSQVTDHTYIPCHRQFIGHGSYDGCSQVIVHN